MNRTLLKYILLFTVMANILISDCHAQPALQEIVRFNIPVGESFCTHVEAGGDINGDGRPDLVFSCIDELHPPYMSVYIYYSIPDSNAVPDQILSGPYPEQGNFGFSIAYAGDLNGDGVSDLVLGCYTNDSVHSGALRIYYGGNPPFTVPDVYISGYGLGYTHDWDLFFSKDILTDCDVNGDGINDLLVYAPGPQWENWGNVFVYLGGEPFSTTPALHIRGSVHEEYLGDYMKTGDINGDGYDDIVLTNRITVDQYPYVSCQYSLKIYPGGPNLTNVAIYDTLLGTSPDLFVAGIIANGDLNGDGFDDIVVSCGAQNNQAWLKVIYGQSDLTELTVIDYVIPELMYGNILSYCNLDNDPYSDFCINSDTVSDGPIHAGNFCVFKQVSADLDIVPDYINPGDYPFNGYGWGYSLGDMNLDGSSEFFVNSWTAVNPPRLGFATILSECYVSNADEVLQPSLTSINCYSNPFRDGVNISIGSNDKAVHLASIDVYNMKGQLVYTGNKSSGKVQHWNGLDSKGNRCSSGIYLIKVLDTKGEIYTTKVVHIK